LKQRVIICESDADCMFYSAILNIPEVRGAIQPDVLFIHAGGKQRLASLADALRALGVTVDIIADIDILNDLTILRGGIEALGGDWPTVESHAVSLKTAVEAHKPLLSGSEIANEISKILKKVPATGEFPRILRAEITSLFKKASPWDAVKDGGKAALPPGEATRHFGALDTICRQFGLWIVPVGELEGFCKEVGGHGPRWVQQVLENYDLARDSRFSEARNFIQTVWQRSLHQ